MELFNIIYFRERFAYISKIPLKYSLNNGTYTRSDNTASRQLCKLRWHALVKYSGTSYRYSSTKPIRKLIHTNKSVSQKSGFCYDPNAATPSEICHEILFREGDNAQVNLVDYKHALKHLAQDGALYAEQSPFAGTESELKFDEQNRL